MMMGWDVVWVGGFGFWFVFVFCCVKGKIKIKKKKRFIVGCDGNFCCGKSCGVDCGLVGKKFYVYCFLF